MEYICNVCKRHYASYQSLWIHNKKYHTCVIINSHPKSSTRSSESNPLVSQGSNNKKVEPLGVTCDTINLINKFSCKYCNKLFKYKQGKWRHEQKCQKKQHNEIIINNHSRELDILKQKVDKLENKTNNKTKINGNINNINNNINNNIIINKTGGENISLLNYEDVSIIFDNEISSVIKLIELVNFSENTPENHSFCSTNLDSPYLSFYNTDTNSINKERKRYFFEEVICKSIENHEILYSSFKNKFNLIKQKQIEDNISSLKKIKENSFSSKIMGEMIRKLNLISYNNRELIQNTWTNSNNKKYDYESDEEFMTMLLDDPETQRVIAKENNKKLNKKFITNINDISSDSDS